MFIPRALPIAAFFIFWLAGAAAEPGPAAATEQVAASLIASAAAVHPGDRIWIGVHQQIIPHWHTYWKNPGDSGLATKIQYQLPPGWNAGDIVWPTPNKIVTGPVVNYGYHDTVTLLSPLQIADDAPVGRELPVGAKVKWLVCEDVCIPQQVELAIRLPVVAPGAPVPAGSPLVDNAKAAWPVEPPWQAALAAATGGRVKLRLSGNGTDDLRNETLQFYPEEWGSIAHGAEQIVIPAADAVEISLEPGDQPLQTGQRLNGVLVVGDGDGAHGYLIDAAWPAVTPDTAPDAAPGRMPATAPPTGNLTLPAALLLAFAGGLILNLMPCVFPVLSLKALALLEQARHERHKTRRHGWAYTAGVMASFAGLAGVLLALKAGGAGIGWGFQFQSPLFVLGMVYLLFAIGLSLSGVFVVGAGITGIGSGLAAGGGYTGSFFTGVLAAVVATPCTAPFMGAAIGFAVTQPAPVMLAVLLSLGAGLALPYWLLCQWPALQHWLPKPGAWMEILKQGLAFPMYATAAWLVWVLAHQAGSAAVAAALGGCVSIALAAWLYRISRNAGHLQRRLAGTSAGILLAAAVGGGYAGVNLPGGEPLPGAETKNRPWQPYSAERLSELRNAGKPVFVNFTADWCITCLVNEKVALGSDRVQNLFRNGGIAYLKADWTNRDPAIAAVLAEFGRSGVPLYLYFAPGAENPVVLPQLLTPDSVAEAVQNHNS